MLKTSQTNQHQIDKARRRWLQNVLFGCGALGLRSAATGIPAAVLLNPFETLLAMEEPAISKALDAARAQFLVLSVSDNGEPMNCNVPGSYIDTNILHPTAAPMAPVSVSLGGQAYTAAGVWSTLPSSAFQRSSFFHYATGSNAHGELPDIYTIHGSVPNKQQLASAFAEVLQAPLGTLQPQPVSLAVGDVVFNNVQQPVFPPTTIKNFLIAPPSLSLLSNLSPIRDQTVDRLYSIIKQRKTTSGQKTLFDAWVSSQQNARQLSQTVLSQLRAISDNSAASQVTTAALLCALKMAPVVVVGLVFGGDNHVDNDPHQGVGPLPIEEGQHVTSLAAINTLLNALSSHNISDKVTFSTMSTFGRSNCTSAYVGRSHNGAHCASLILGANVKGGVVGGVRASGLSLQAQDIDSKSGLAASGGDIPWTDSLASFATTLGATLGIDDQTLTSIVGPGTKVESVLAS